MRLFLGLNIGEKILIAHAHLEWLATNWTGRRYLSGPLRLLVGGRVFHAAILSLPNAAQMTPSKPRTPSTTIALLDGGLKQQFYRKSCLDHVTNSLGTAETGTIRLSHSPGLIAVWEEIQLGASANLTGGVRYRFWLD